MEIKEMAKAAISRLSESQKFNYYKFVMSRGYETYEEVLEYSEMCYSDWEGLTVEQIYQDCVEIAEDF